MRNPDRETFFRFKQFNVVNRRSAMKVGTDGVLLGAWCFRSLPEDAPLRILDVGCGTGLIALMLAQRFPAARIVALDIDADAVEEARANFAASPWAGRLEAIRADFNCYAAETHPDGSFDLIVSNPPFFTGQLQSPDSSRACARHQDSLSLASLIAAAPALLAPAGRLALVAPAEYQDSICFEASLARMVPDRVALVRTVTRKPPRRILVELSLSTSAQSSSPAEILIQNPDGSPGHLYASLVSPFYLKF